MQVFLVGGAVRDELLGLVVKDRDWVVVGSNPEEMMDLGFTPVGRDFPVFLHPQTREEYALARTERKSAPGYHGFTFHASPEVTLEEDLARRDLTINAMARSESGNLIDPFGGERDLKARVFRHVSPAFQEDPVRVLRLARFAARFPEFTLHEDTLQLARSMARQGEIQALVGERVWAEVTKGLMEKKPSRLFEVLMACEAFKTLWPCCTSLEEDPVAKERFMLSLNESAKNSCSLEIRFGLSFYPFTGQPISKIDAQSLCESLKASSSSKEMGLLILQLASSLIHTSTLTPRETLDTLESLDAFRRPDRFKEGLFACTLGAQCSKDHQTLERLSSLSKAIARTEMLDPQELSAKALSMGLKGPEIGQYIHQARLSALENTL